MSSDRLSILIISSTATSNCIDDENNKDKYTPGYLFDRTPYGMWESTCATDLY